MGLKSYSCAFSKKVIFSIVKDFFNWFEGLCRSVIVLVGSTGGLIVDLGGLRKKYLLRCQTSSSKLYLCVFRKSDFQYSQGLVQMI